MTYTFNIPFSPTKYVNRKGQTITIDGEEKVLEDLAKITEDGVTKFRVRWRRFDRETCTEESRFVFKFTASEVQSDINALTQLLADLNTLKSDCQAL